MQAVRRNALTQLFFRIHPWIYRQTGGRLLGRLGNSPILLLHTVGRRSGLPRTNGLVTVEQDGGWLVAASFAGEPKVPVWYRNLMTAPDTTIQIRDRVVPVRARDLEGEERDLAWKEIVAQEPSFAEYEERTRGVREIPVVRLEPRETKVVGSDTYVMYGLGCSYFTGKLEAYFENKGLPYRSIEMTTKQMRDFGTLTGVAQLPCIETPDGRWLTDTTAIIEELEAKESGPAVRPADSAVAFLSLLLEDLFDEWYWRPALYYRWAFEEDSRLMSRQLARTMMSEVKLPLFVRRLFVLYRQRAVYLKKDGITKQTAPAVEKHYLDSLRALDAIFAKRPFLFGERPCEADYGLFGPFFRHFFCDPTPGALMRTHAPHLTHWVTRLWTTRPADLADKHALTDVPSDLGFFFEQVANDYFPYLEANSRAVAAGEDQVRFRAQGVDWQIPTAPYRAECLNALKQRYAELDSEAAECVATVLPSEAIAALRAAPVAVTRRTDRRGRSGRLGRALTLIG